MRTLRITAALCAALLALATLAGCGGGSGNDVSDLSANQLLAKARKQVDNAEYVTIKGKIENGSQTIGLDISYVGDDSHGTISINGNDLEIESVDGKTYFKPSKSFWKAQMGGSADTIVKAIGDKWIAASASDSSFDELIALTKRSLISKEMLRPEGKVTKGETKTVNDVDSIELETRKGSLFVSRDDARPVQLVGSGADSSGSADFSYDEVEKPQAPSSDDVFDLSKFQ